MVEAMAALERDNGRERGAGEQAAGRHPRLGHALFDEGIPALPAGGGVGSQAVVMPYPMDGRASP